MDIRALASHLGLSIGTVSRALNDRKDVSPVTRQRVLEAAATFGYTPNQFGRTLRSGRTATIGFMLTLEHDSAVHGDPFFMALLEGVQAELVVHDLDLVILLARKGEDGETFLRRHIARGTVDGWLLSGTQYQDPRIALLSERGIPFVTLGRTGEVSDHAWIDLDFEGLVSEAMSLLLAEGHRRIGLVSPPATINYSHVVAATYQKALIEAGLQVDGALIHYGETDEHDGEAATRELLALEQPPSALLLMGETAPVGAYRALRGLGREPGRDIAVVGLRDNPTCQALSPDLTCFNLDLNALGSALARGLVDVIASKERGSSARVQMRWPLALRLRESHKIKSVEQAPLRVAEDYNKGQRVKVR
ncbi:substrate-binding domain-containing protein [Sphingomonas yunnanensis]|uniref:substrate-binding domain-containing protein n=1 Tax=Sphingomonas yunnanensis TaxID=310400 RepID=UPI001CA6BB10|nr:substrate-binding domain-containing protein [Sphingomonas yunnanensis]MBY9064909.1 substrate-binding domain-containing protein [Sphingomonas yunnanensis]